MRRKRTYTSAEREAILADYLSGNLTQQEIAEKYDLRCRTLISVWLKRRENAKLVVPLQPSTNLAGAVCASPSDIIMKKKTFSTPEEEVEALRSELRQLRRELNWEKKRALAFETLIQIAEEHGMHVKKYGAKQ